jgi:Beta-propeller repeat
MFAQQTQHWIQRSHNIDVARILGGGAWRMTLKRSLAVSLLVLGLLDTTACARWFWPSGKQEDWTNDGGSTTVVDTVSTVDGMPKDSAGTTNDAQSSGPGAIKMVWTQTVGGSGQDRAEKIAIDSVGNLFVTGYFEGTSLDFDPGPATDLRTSNGAEDVFVMKLNADGSYAWTSTFGGPEKDWGRALTVDRTDNILATGRFKGQGVDFDSGAGTSSHSSTANGSDIFVTRLDNTGSYLGTMTAGGPGDDLGRNVFVDGAGNVYLSGDFSGTDADLDPTSGSTLHTSAGYGDLFVTKLDPGFHYVWSRSAGGTWGEGARGLAVDSSGNVFVCGWFYSTADMDPSSGVDNRTSNGSNDIYVTKLRSDGSYAWSHTMGGTSGDNGLALTVDGTGNVYVAGVFGGIATDLDPTGTFDLHSSNGGSDVFVTRINANGTYGWTRTFGGPGNDVGQDIQYDGAGRIYIVGSFSGTSTDFNRPGPPDPHDCNGAEDIFVTQLHTDGSYGWTLTMGGAGIDTARSVAIGPAGKLGICGRFEQTMDFDPAPTNEDVRSSQGASDLFVSVFQR